jgi:hypothetical protein
LKRKLEKLCSEHSKDYKKRPEHYWREIIDNNFHFQASITDTQVCAQLDKNTKKKYRPDRCYLISDNNIKVAIILELDEDSHSDEGYKVECEISRLVNMRDAFSEYRVLVIRMNPNVCKSAPTVMKDMLSRTLFMIEIMKMYYGNLYERLDDMRTNVIYLFYGQGGIVHINEANKNKDKVVVLDTLYCDN